MSVFKMWNTIDKTALDSNPSLHWLLREPILKGARLEIPWKPGSLIRCGVVTVKTFVQLTGGNIADTMALAAKLGLELLCESSGPPGDPLDSHCGTTSCKP